jgi:MFS family permease
MSRQRDRFTHLLVGLYRRLLGLYSPRFRDEFGPEMAEVFRQAAEDTAAGGFVALIALLFCELSGLPSALISQKKWKGVGLMEATPSHSGSTPAESLSAGEAALGLLPLVVLALGNTLRELPLTGPQAMFWMGVGFMGPYPVVLAGLLWGWLKGFPRWVYPYLAYGFFFALYISFASTPGFAIFGIQMWGRQLWAWRAFVPLGLIVALALLLSRPWWSPIVKMARAVWNDWTLLAYGLYGFLPLVIPIVLDETGRDYRFLVTAIACAGILVGAIFYMFLPRSRLRTILMLAGAFLSLLVASIGSSLYWKTHTVDFLTNERGLIEEPIPWGSVIFPALIGSAVFILVLLILPVLIGLVHRLVRFLQSGSTGAKA